MNREPIRMAELILLAARRRALKKAIFSKPDQREQLKTVVTLRAVGGREVLQAECFTADNKAIHKNLTVEEATDALALLASSHGQVNLLTTAGDCELRRSKNGERFTLLGDEKLERRLRADAVEALSVEGNDRGKQRILSGNEPFLRHLGVSDQNGRIHDKKQAKFRQINRFLEMIRDCLPSLPAEGVLRICDLCCGKSYLSFAAYHYFVNVLGREVRMTGVDLKPDVVEHCNTVAKELGFLGLEFLCGDVSQYDAGGRVHLVISLHACDIATDLVLERAVRWGADVILSTPCCHHELNHKINCAPLRLVTDHSMLRQKLCDAVTDALRLKFLESRGYAVSALELIDPDETPKNIMLRGLRRPDFDPDSPAARRALEEYLSAREFFTGGTSDVQEILHPSVRG
ncbi:MAG: SAM-dependent methyltransferase [Ruminococcaceae bacterium]|nr:SAM-dependent methyltransferase [Oscillospiraceae bacterium]